MERGASDRPALHPNTRGRGRSTWTHCAGCGRPLPSNESHKVWVNDDGTTDASRGRWCRLCDPPNEGHQKGPSTGSAP
jgi:hypothetical protein